jgi:glycosyltransferase involved in cell wall biosynthesis
LAEAGYDVSIVDIGADQSCPIREQDRGIIIEHVMVSNWLTSRKIEIIFMLKAIHAFISCTLLLVHCNADIYHACDFKALPATSLAAFLRRKQLVFEMFDLQFPVPDTNITFWRKLGWLIVLIHKIVLPHCAAVITTSPFHTKELLKRFSIPKIVTVRNAVAFRPFYKSNCLREYLGLGSDVQIALYQGNLSPDRGLDVLVYAAPFLEPGIVIVMMGEDVGFTQAGLESLIREKHVADRVKIIPSVPYKELLQWTASADIGMTISSPSSFNMRLCFPNKLSEYLMAGLPVLSAPMVAVKELIIQYDVGFVVSSLSPAEVANGINALLKDPVRLARMRENALQVAQELCWEKESMLLIEAYKGVVAKLNGKRKSRIIIEKKRGKRC